MHGGHCFSCLSAPSLPSHALLCNDGAKIANFISGTFHCPLPFSSAYQNAETLRKKTSFLFSSSYQCHFSSSSSLKPLVSFNIPSLKSTSSGGCSSLARVPDGLGHSLWSRLPRLILFDQAFSKDYSTSY